MTQPATVQPPEPTVDGRREAPVRRRRHRRRRLRPPRRDRRTRGGRQGRHRLQVAARQGPHGDGRGRRRRRAGQPLARRQLAGPLPRHHARRQDAEQLADGPAARAGGARAGAGARGLGRAVRPHQGRPDLPARLRRPPLRPPRPRRRPHRPGDDPHPPAARGRSSASTSSWSARSPTCGLVGLRRRPRVSGAFGYWRETGRFIAFEAPAIVLATGGIGKCFKVTSNSWEYTGDGHALALRAGAKLINMEFVQFHPTGMVWPPSVKGLLVTESVRGDGGILKNSEGKRFMFDYIPEFFKAETADSEEEADRWYDDKKNNRRPPELLPRDEVARAINSEIKAGRGTEHGGIFLDIASRRTPEFIRKRLPSMYHQFKELADVDITAEPMEIGPTCHYVMGGVEVDPDTEMSGVGGLYAVGECSGGMHGSNRLGGNSLSDLLVFGKRAGDAAAAYVGRSERRAALADRCRADGRRRARGLAVHDDRRGRGRVRHREPVHDPAGPPADDERPGRHHPHPRGAGAVAGRDREAQGAGAAPRGRRATGGTTPAGTSRSTCATCCWSRSASPRRRWSARSRAAATPVTTSRLRRPMGHAEPRTVHQRRGRRRRPRHPAAAGDAGRPGDVLRGRALI